jgi:ABC-type multidrug transport system fused ATPase/permease subunit
MTSFRNIFRFPPLAPGSRNRDLRVLARLYEILTKSEKRAILLSLTVRLGLVSLDIIGLSLIGVTVALVSGSGIDRKSLTGRAIGLLAASGLENVYAVFGFAAVAFFIAKGLFSISLNALVLRRVARIESSKSSAMFQRVAAGNIEQLQAFSATQLVSGLINSYDMSVSKLIMSCSTIFGELALISGISIYLVLVNPILFCVIAVYFTVLILVMQTLVANRTRNAASAIQEKSISAGETVFSLFDNFRQLRSMGKTESLREDFAHSRAEIAIQGATLNSLTVLPRYITEIALMLGFALLLLQRSIAGSSGIDAATVAIFVAASFRIIASLLPLQGSLALLKQVSAVGELTLQLAETFEDGVSPSLDRLETDNPEAFGISSRKVSYAYPGSQNRVLNNVDFYIPEGSYVALVGESGSGKSTIADLTMGLRRPLSGELKIGDLAAEDFVTRFPGAVAYVPQQCDLLRGSLAYNVSLDHRNTDVNRVHGVLDAVGLLTWAEDLESGINTLLDKNTRGLSGGQLQRLGLARALYVNPKVIILDESTSALDNESESRILQALDKLRGKVTILAIAHRGSVIEHADRSLTLTQGKITWT